PFGRSGGHGEVAPASRAPGVANLTGSSRPKEDTAVTERDFEQRLRDEFRQMVDEAAPPALRASVIAIPDVVPPTPERRWTAGWRFPSMNRFAPFALVAAAVIVTVLIGISLVLRLPPSVGPLPIPVPTHA